MVQFVLFPLKVVAALTKYALSGCAYVLRTCLSAPHRRKFKGTVEDGPNNTVTRRTEIEAHVKDTVMVYSMNIYSRTFTIESKLQKIASR